jgi:predicted ATPase
VITGLSITNFKRFRRADLELGKLTVLTGVNGGGKSTVVQALNLVHQCELAGQNFVPLTGCPGLDLGQAADVLAAGAASDEIEVSLVRSPPGKWTFGTGSNPEATRLDVLARPSDPFPPVGARDASFTYLAAERLGPRAAHPTSPWAEGSVAVGEDGRFVAHALALSDRSVPVERRHHDAASVLLRPQVEAWMTGLVGPLQIEARFVSRTGLATIYVHAGGFEAEWMLLTNTGFGISYSLPIVVAGLSVPRGGLLIVDSPEAHLHPAAQSAMGQFLSIVAASGVQVIVETHSDHVLNGVRRAIAGELCADDGEPLRHSDAVVYYFGREADPIPLAISASGALSDWPAGFFDQMEIDLGFINRRKRK